MEITNSLEKKLKVTQRSMEIAMLGIRNNKEKIDMVIT